MPVDNSDYLDPDGFSSPLSIQHDELEWREVTDSYDTIVCYIATADRPAQRRAMARNLGRRAHRIGERSVVGTSRRAHA